MPREDHQGQWLYLAMVSIHACMCLCVCALTAPDNWRAQWKTGITVFDDPKRSKVNEAFSLSSKLLWLKFNSWICVLLKSSLVIFLDTKKNVVLTFDLLGLSKTVIPFFHWALQLQSLVSWQQYLKDSCTNGCHVWGAFTCHMDKASHLTVICTLDGPIFDLPQPSWWGLILAKTRLAQWVTLPRLFFYFREM